MPNVNEFAGFWRVPWHSQFDLSFKNLDLPSENEINLGGLRNRNARLRPFNLDHWIPMTGSLLDYDEKPAENQFDKIRDHKW